jgi:phage tail sheath protein FI
VVLEKALSEIAKYVIGEFNDEYTRSAFTNLVNQFMRSIQSRKGVVDFRVVCDETNNTAQVIDSNQFVADIYIKPTRSINFIQLNFVATRSDVNMSIIE